jgi:hypothetical protein
MHFHCINTVYFQSHVSAGNLTPFSQIQTELFRHIRTVLNTRDKFAPSPAIPRQHVAVTSCQVLLMCNLADCYSDLAVYFACRRPSVLRASESLRVVTTPEHAWLHSLVLFNYCTCRVCCTVKSRSHYHYGLTCSGLLIEQLRGSVLRRYLQMPWPFLVIVFCYSICTFSYEYDVKIRTGFIWLRIGFSGGLLWTRW